MYSRKEKKHGKESHLMLYYEVKTFIEKKKHELWSKERESFFVVLPNAVKKQNNKKYSFTRHESRSFCKDSQLISSLV